MRSLILGSIASLALAGLAHAAEPLIQVATTPPTEVAPPVIVTPITVYAAAPEALWAFNYRDETWPGDGSYKVWASASREYCEADRAGMPADKVSTSACVYTHEYSSAH